MVAQVDVTVQRLLDACGASFDVIEPEKKGKWGYSNSGQLSAENARIETIDGTLVTPSTTPLCSPSAQGAVPGSPTAVSAATPTPTSAVPAAVPRMMSTKHPYSFADVSIFLKHILKYFFEILIIVALLSTQRSVSCDILFSAFYYSFLMFSVNLLPCFLLQNSTSFTAARSL